MTLSIVGGTASGTSDSQSSSRAVNVPAGSAAGDIALLAIEQWWDSGTNPTITYPAGFTQIVNFEVSDSGLQRLKVAWKRLTSTDSGTYNMTWTGTQWNMAHCVMVRGCVSAGDPVDFVNTASAAGTTAIPSISGTATENDLLLHFVVNSNAARANPPTGFTELLDGDYLHSNYKLNSGTGLQTASGGTLASSSTPILVSMLGLKPEPDIGGGGDETSKWKWNGTAWVPRTRHVRSGGVWV
jgi:hypothetical protein